MNTLAGWQRARVLMLSPLPLIVISAGWCGVLWAVDRAAGRRARGILLSIGVLWPGLILASSFLLLLDNFTYTLLRVGVRTTSGLWRYAYVAVFLLFWAFGWRLCAGVVRGLSARRKGGVVAPLLAGMLAVSWLVFSPAGAGRAGGLALGGQKLRKGDLPNIMLLGWDGVSAENLSLYGYERDTTPFLRTFARKQALVCENAFANAQNSGSSVASMLTGKIPTALRLYYSPEILIGRNAYEHLPGILRHYGYKTVDIGVREYADAYDLNMLHSFEQASTRKEKKDWWQTRTSKWLGMSTGYFLESSWERLRDRLLHALGTKDTVSAYEVVVGATAAGWVQDREEIDQLMQVISSPDSRPFFVHAHLLCTHWPVAAPKHPVFSKGRERNGESERDFYDDAILELDAAFSRIIEALRKAGRLDNTILVFTSDHSRAWGPGRVPLVFWFPDGARSRRIRMNAQNMDIAPTLLDYLGLPVPEWMGGMSLLKGEPPKRRPIFFTAANDRLVDTKKWLLDASRLKAPFYSLGVLGMRVGDRIYTLNLDTPAMTVDLVQGHTCPLGDEEAMTVHGAWNTLVNHLEENGYRVPADFKQGELVREGGSTDTASTWRLRTNRGETTGDPS